MSMVATAMVKVEYFKYLGVHVTFSQSKHVEEICKRASKQIGFIFRKFHKHSSPATLKQL